jgi:hypothetical protein
MTEAEKVVQFVKDWHLKGITVKTIAQKLGLKRKVVSATLFTAMKYDPGLRVTERTPLSVKKRRIWYYGDVFDRHGEDFFHRKA